MFLNPPVFTHPEAGLYELAEPLVYACAVPGAPPAITVPLGFSTRFDFLPGRLRGWVLPRPGGNPMCPPAVLCAYMLATQPDLAPAVFREALSLSGVPWWKRFLLGTAV